MTCCARCKRGTRGLGDFPCGDDQCRCHVNDLHPFAVEIAAVYPRLAAQHLPSIAVLPPAGDVLTANTDEYLSEGLIEAHRAKIEDQFRKTETP